MGWLPTSCPDLKFTCASKRRSCPCRSPSPPRSSCPPRVSPPLRRPPLPTCTGRRLVSIWASVRSSQCPAQFRQKIAVQGDCCNAKSSRVARILVRPLVGASSLATLAPKGREQARSYLSIPAASAFPFGCGYAALGNLWLKVCQPGLASTQGCGIRVSKRRPPDGRFHFSRAAGAYNTPP